MPSLVMMIRVESIQIFFYKKKCVFSKLNKKKKKKKLKDKLK